MKKIWIVISAILILGVLYLLWPSSKNVLILEKGINPGIGDLSSNITIIEFSDFQCPACKKAEPVIKEILQNYNVSFYYRNFPLSMHSNSIIAAEAAECANEQNRFWEYHDILFENQDKLDEDSLKKYAKELEMNETKFNSCIEGRKYKSAVQKDLNDAISLKLKGTPTFFINSEEIFGADKDLMIKKIIEELK